MSDQTNSTDVTSPDGDSDVSTEPEGRQTKEDGAEYWKLEAEQARQRRDAAAKRARDYEKRVKELETKLDELDQVKAKEGGDLEALQKNFEKQLAKAKEETEGLHTKLKRVIVEKEVRAIASRYAYDDKAADTIWRLMSGDFELSHDDDGNDIPRVKNSPVSIEQYIKEFLEDHPYLAKNTRKGGTGADKTDGKSSANGTITPDKLAMMSPAEQKEFFKKNPDAAKFSFRL